MQPSATAIVWLADTATIPDALLAPRANVLGPGEHQRFERFLRQERRRQFLFGRLLLRHAITEATGLPASAQLVTERPAQAPLLAFSGSRLPVPYFSLSHSGSWVACAISAEPIGLDVETLDPSRDLAALAQHTFSQPEAADILALPDDEKMGAFYRLWSRKEAEFKLGKPAACCHFLAHPTLSIAVCGAAMMAEPPVLQLVSLA